MTLPERRRYFLLGLLLTATLAVAAVSGIEQGEDRVPSTGGREPAGTPERPARLALSRVSREPIETVEVDIFEARTWQPAPPPPPNPQEARPAAPSTPPLPFVYAGQIGDLQTGKVIVYLTRGDVVYTVSAGDVLDERYRLESITERQLTFVYLPMKAQQTLVIPGN